jgi:glutathione S-transferase
MRLFDFKRAPNPRRVRIFLAEKGIEIPTVPVNLYRMEQLSPEFLAINPGGTVPVLETDDGTCLTECVAICRYLERLHPEPVLFGTSATSEALTLMWNNIVENEGITAVAEILRNLSPGFAHRVFPGPLNIEQLPQLVDRGRLRANQFFDRVERRLTESPFLAGDEFSLADITLLATVDFGDWVDLNAPANRPSLARWHAKVSARPSARR